MSSSTLMQSYFSKGDQRPNNAPTMKTCQKDAQKADQSYSVLNKLKHTRKVIQGQRTSKLEKLRIEFQTQRRIRISKVI